MPAIKLASAPEIKPTEVGQWELVLWVDETKYRTIPFRRFLDEIAALYQAGSVSAALPLVARGEDFVCGTLTIGDTELMLYSEQRPLAYLTVSNQDRTVLEELCARLEPIVRVTPQKA